jgi:predicted P-loop ATPase/GTPase
LSSRITSVKGHNDCSPTGIVFLLAPDADAAKELTGEVFKHQTDLLRIDDVRETRYAVVSEEHLDLPEVRSELARQDGLARAKALTAKQRRESATKASKAAAKARTRKAKERKLVQFREVQ